MNDDDRFSPENLARVVRWGIILFLFYVFLQNLHLVGIGEKPKEEPEVAANKLGPATAQKPDDKDCDGNVFNNFSLFAIPIFPVSSSTVAISDIKKGTGEPAVCGQKATFNYAYARRGGDIIYNNLKGEPTKDVLIGGGEIVPGFSRGLIGMKPGGERDISIPADLGFGGVKKIEDLRDHDKFKFGGITGFMTARVTLDSVSPELPKSDFKLRLIDQHIGDGRPFECGDEVSIKLTLWKLDGSSLYSNEKSAPLHFTIGKSQLPYGIEQGVSGMAMSGSRTIIIPPAYSAQLVEGTESLLKDVTIPKNEMIIAIIQTVPEVKPEPAKPESPLDAKPATPAKDTTTDKE